MQLHATTMLYLAVPPCAASVMPQLEHSSDLWHAALACCLQLYSWWWKGCAAATMISISETIQAHTHMHTCLQSVTVDSWGCVCVFVLYLCKYVAVWLRKYICIALFDLLNFDCANVFSNDENVSTFLLLNGGFIIGFELVWRRRAFSNNGKN